MRIRSCHGGGRDAGTGWALPLGGFCVAALGALACSSPGAPSSEVQATSLSQKAPSETAGEPAGAWAPVGAATAGPETADPAAVYADRRAREQAIERLSADLEQTPDDVAMLERRGGLFASLGFLRPAEKDFERATLLSPREPRLWLALGRARVELQLPSGGLQALRRAKDLGYDDQELHLLTARAHRALDERREAQLHYALAIERPPAPSAALLVEAASLALAMPEEGGADERAKAGRWIEQALAREPDYAEAWLVKGFLLELNGGAGDPCAAFRRAVELDPANLEAWTSLALFFHEQGDRERCGEAVRRALKLEKRDARRRALEELIEDPEVAGAESASE